jgi:glycyl-tRNA synthetase alpha subunit
MLWTLFDLYEKEAFALMDAAVPLPAYDYVSSARTPSTAGRTGAP